MELQNIDKEIYDCNLCSEMVEKFPNSKTVSIGKNNEIVILGEAPANNGWRKSGVAWYDINHKLLPSGVVMQKLLDILNIKLEDTYFLEAIKCYPRDRKYLNKCSNNCRQYLLKQLEIIKPKVILSLGDSATKTILDIKYKKFSDVVGKKYDLNGMTIIPIYHPSPISPKSYTGNIDIFNKLKQLMSKKGGLIMNERMKKKELLELIESLNIDRDEFWILSSSALVIRDLFEDAGDLDIAVTEKGLEQLKQNFDLKQKENGWYIVNEKVECVLDTKEPWKIEKYDSYNLESFEKYFQYLKSSTREKDKIKYEIVKERLMLLNEAETKKISKN